jgi:hypothetical protein
MRGCADTGGRIGARRVGRVKTGIVRPPGRQERVHAGRARTSSGYSGCCWTGQAFQDSGPQERRWSESAMKGTRPAGATGGSAMARGRRARRAAIERVAAGAARTGAPARWVLPKRAARILIDELELRMLVRTA